MYVTKIRMKPGCYRSNKLVEIDSLYIEDCVDPGFYSKTVIYDYVKNNPGSIQVKRYPYPTVVGEISANGEKYVRSSPNDYIHDNLLDLPRVMS